MRKNSVFLNDRGVIEVHVVGDQTVRSVQNMADGVERLVKEQHDNGKPALVLDSLVHVGKVPSEARKIVVERGKAVDYDRLVFLGSGTALRLAANLLLQAIGKGQQVRYFDDYDNAIRWLKQKSEKAH